MGKASRDKGTRGELEVAHILKDHGFDAERTPNSGGLRTKGDLATYDQRLEDFHFEVKFQKQLALPAWMRQAEEEADGKVPIVVYRLPRQPWQASLPFDALCELLKRPA